MAYSQVTGMSSTRFPLKGLGGCGCQSTSGLGQTMDPETRWRYTSYALGALIVAQFFWWNAKAPQVLKLSRNRRRRRRH